MKNTRRKKKRSPAPKPTCKGAVGNKDGEKVGGGRVEAEDGQNREMLEKLVGAFSLTSPVESALACKDAEEDLDKSDQIPIGCFVDNSKDSSTCSSSSGFSSSDFASTSGSSEGFMESNYVDMSCANGFRRGKQKKISAAMGTVSTVLGKEYMRRNSSRPNGYHNDEIVGMAEKEQFLCSMLGNDSDISLAVVRDVLCQCGYNVDKALDVLLEMSMPSHQQSDNARVPDCAADNVDDMRFPAYHDNLMDSRSECTSFSSEGEFSDNFWSLGSFRRNYADVLSGCKAQYDDNSGNLNLKSDLPQRVLESLFDIHKNTEHDKDAMNWSNVVKKMQALAPKYNASRGVVESQQHNNAAKGDGYHVYREDARQHWDSMRSYYQKATSAYTKKDRAYAAYLSDQGREQSNLAQKADAKASHDIFMARNKGIENVITIDLHGQHIKPAMRMLKLHLIFGSFVPSVQTLRVITGCGSHGVGKSKLKQSVVKLLEKEKIEWYEENRGTVIIKPSGTRDFSFLDTDTDGDDD